MTKETYLQMDFFSQGPSWQVVWYVVSRDGDKIFLCSFRTAVGNHSCAVTVHDTKDYYNNYPMCKEFVMKTRAIDTLFSILNGQYFTNYLAGCL